MDKSVAVEEVGKNTMFTGWWDVPENRDEAGMVYCDKCYSLSCIRSEKCFACGDLKDLSGETRWVNENEPITQKDIDLWGITKGYKG